MKFSLFALVFSISIFLAFCLGDATADEARGVYKCSVMANPQNDFPVAFALQIERPQIGGTVIKVAREEHTPLGKITSVRTYQRGHRAVNERLRFQLMLAALATKATSGVSPQKAREVNTIFVYNVSSGGNWSATVYRLLSERQELGGSVTLPSASPDRRTRSTACLRRIAL